MSKKTVATIRQSGNQYVIAVKANQHQLHKALERCFRADGAGPDSSYLATEYNRGRLELRSIKVIGNLSDHLPETLLDKWAGLKEIIEVERLTWRKGKRSCQRVFYISSLSANALFYFGIIRSHWGIENSLHWVKDVSMSEDRSKIRLENAAQNLSLMRNIGIDRFRLKGNYGIKRAQRIAANDIHQLKEYCS